MRRATIPLTLDDLPHLHANSSFASDAAHELEQPKVSFLILALFVQKLASAIAFPADSRRVFGLSWGE